MSSGTVGAGKVFLNKDVIALDKLKIENQDSDTKAVNNHRLIALCAQHGRTLVGASPTVS